MQKKEKEKKMFKIQLENNSRKQMCVVLAREAKILCRGVVLKIIFSLSLRRGFCAKILTQCHVN